MHKSYDYTIFEVDAFENETIIYELVVFTCPNDPFLSTICWGDA